MSAKADTIPDVEILYDDEEEEDFRFVEYYGAMYNDFIVETAENCEEIPDDCSVHCVAKSTIISVEEITYDCYFHGEDNMCFELQISNGEQTENYTVPATIKTSGALNGTILEDDDGHIYRIGTYSDDTALGDIMEEALSSAGLINSPQKVGPQRSRLLSFLKIFIRVVVPVYAAVARTAEQIKAEKNYEKNQARDSGVIGYIEWQTDSSCANYDFGFAKFYNKGCEVAAVYNAMLAMGRGEPLSETIYKFEKWGIEFDCGWGFLGSNPREIYRYFKKEKIRYMRCFTESSFDSEVSYAPQAHLIMSNWNNPITTGLHTFYLHGSWKNGIVLQGGYNNYRSYNAKVRTGTCPSDFNGKQPFIVGYIIYG